MSTGFTAGAKSLAAIIMVPLVIVAALVTFNLTGGDALEKEAKALAATLDQTLARLPEDAQAAVAVLPLSNSSGDPALDFIAAGVAEALRAQLTGVTGVRVIGVESSSNVASQPLALTSMARLLGVRYLLRGAVAGDEDAVVIEFELASSDGETIWRDTWQSSALTLATTTNAVNARVLQTIAPAARPLPDGADAGRYSGQAFADYLRGKYLIDRHNGPDVLEGIAFLERAIAAEPGYEDAYWAKIAGHQRMTWIDAQAAPQHAALIEQTIDDWLALNAETPLTYRLKSLRAANEQRPMAAYAAFQNAVRLAPQLYAYDRGYMSGMCAAGYIERCLEQAIGLALLEPVSAAAHAGLANAYLLLGERELMREHGRLSTRFGGDLGEFYEAQALIDEEMWTSASTALAHALDNVGVDSSWVATYLEVLAGDGTADTAAAAMSAVDDSSAEWLDLFYTQLARIGELDLAFAAAQILIAEKYQTWNLFLWSEKMYAFRNDPRFMDLMNAIGMVEAWQELGPPDCCLGADPEPFCDGINP